MTHIQWHGTFDPFRDLRTLQERMNRIFEAKAVGGTATEEGPVAPPGFPALEVRRDAEAIHVTAELPGVPLESIDVSVTGDLLTIKGERKAPDVAQEKWHRRERRFGRFSRAVTLPDRVDADRIAATLKDGILRIDLPKAESAKPRQVKIAQG